jgi:cyclopropane-fatty-acyl-phospholipid synthase
MPTCSRSRRSGAGAASITSAPLDWLSNFDANRVEIETILRKVYGEDTALWMRRWRWFFLATAGLFGYAGGSEWGVSHYRMKAA